MINKRIIIGIILFIIGGLIVFTFANPAPNEEPVPNIPEEEEPIIPEEPVVPEEPVIPVEPVVPVVPVTPVTPDDDQAAINLAARIAAARAAVVRVEGTLNQTDLNNAQRLVSALPSGPTRTGFNARLTAVQSQIDLANQFARAIAAVELAETTKSQVSVNTAAELVAALPVGTIKTDLTARLVTVQTFINVSDTNKLAAIATLNAHVIAKGMSNYSSVNWTLILTHQTNGVTAINAAATAGEVDTALANAIANVDAVVTVIATAKSLAIADLNKLVDDFTEEYYTVENWSTIQSYKTRATNAINGATTVPEIRNIHTMATAKINEIEMMLEPTRMLALANVNALMASLVQADYTPANWDIIVFYYEKAIEEINASTTVALINRNYLNRTDKIKAVETILMTAKRLAIEELKDIFEDLDDDDYYEANWTMIVDYHTAGIAAINASTTVPMVRSAFTLARTNFEMVETKEEADIRLLAEAKTLAIASINNLVAGLIQADYDAETWAKILEYQGEAMVEINEADTLAEVAEALAYRTRKIDEKLTMLEAAKSWAIEELDDLVDDLDVYDYTNANWTMIINYRRTGIIAIDNATTQEMVTSAYTLARTNIEAVGVDFTTKEKEAIAAVEKYERKLDDDYRRDAEKAVDKLSSSTLKTELELRITQIETLLDDSSEVINNFLTAVDLVKEFEEIPTLANKNAARAALDLIKTHTMYNSYYIVGNLEARYTAVVNALS